MLVHFQRKIMKKTYIIYVTKKFFFKFLEKSDKKNFFQNFRKSSNFSESEKKTLMWYRCLKIYFSFNSQYSSCKWYFQEKINYFLEGGHFKSFASNLWLSIQRFNDKKLRKVRLLYSFWVSQTSFNNIREILISKIRFLSLR